MDRNWPALSKDQLNRFAQRWAQLEFLSYGFDLYTAEAESRHIAFLARAPGREDWYEVQVKLVRGWGYAFWPKGSVPLRPDRLMCLLRFVPLEEPEVYVIPAQAWRHPGSLLVSRDYDQPEQRGTPEWGVNVSKGTLERLQAHRIGRYMASIGLGEPEGQERSDGKDHL